MRLEITVPGSPYRRQSVEMDVLQRVKLELRDLLSRLEDGQLIRVTVEEIEDGRD